MKQRRGDSTTGSDSSEPAASLDLGHNSQSGENGQSPEPEVGSRGSAGHSDISLDAFEDGLGPLPGWPVRGDCYFKMGSDPDLGDSPNKQNS